MELVEKNIEDFKKTNKVEKDTLVQYCDEESIISIPKQIHILGESAFRNTNIIAVYMPASIKIILDGKIEEARTEEERDKFLGCFSQCLNLQTIRLSPALQNIPACCFSNCISLNNISLLNSNIIEISKMAFYGCTNLYDITLPENLQIIQMYAFYNCGAHILTIPKTIKYIGKYAFSGMTSNQTVIFEGSQESTALFHPAWNCGADCKFVFKK